MLAEAPGGASVVGDGDKGSEIGDGGRSGVWAGEGDVFAETMEERGKTGASAEGYDAQPLRVGRRGVMIRRRQAVFWRFVLAQCG
jgi:hypothetical protein